MSDIKIQNERALNRAVDELDKCAPLSIHLSPNDEIRKAHELPESAFIKLVNNHKIFYCPRCRTMAKNIDPRICTGCFHFDICPGKKREPLIHGLAAITTFVNILLGIILILALIF
jgi:hypothetical protein